MKKQKNPTKKQSSSLRRIVIKCVFYAMLLSSGIFINNSVDAQENEKVQESVQASSCSSCTSKCKSGGSGDDQGLTSYGYCAGNNGKFAALFGYRAGNSNTGTGSYNTFIGAYSGYSNISGSNNVFLGYQAGYNETGSNKLYIANGSTSTLIYGDFSSKKVGIGITDPNANLDVAGIAHFSGLTSPSTPIQGAYIGWNALTSSTGETDFINHKGLGTGGFAFYNTGGNGSSRTLQMLIDGNGNVGIGVTSPSQISQRLEVAGNVRTTGLLTVIGAGNSSFSGNLGIGTTSPSERLEVAGNVRTTGVLTVIGVGNSSFSGNLGIGTTTIPIGSKLAVNGKITAKALQLTKVGWSDFVFDEQYVLPSLTEVEAFIKKNKHLSEIPSAKEVEEQGIDMGKMDALLLQKIEELTLYIIHQQKEIETLKIQVNKK